MDALMLPSNWQKVRLGDIAEIKRGASPRPIENPKWFCANSNVGWVRISDISKNSRFLYKTAQKLSKKGIEKSRFIKQNSLIMSMCATIGKPIITKIDTCIHDGFVVFENPKIDLNYLYYFLCYIEKEWLESGQQGSQVNLNVDLIKNKEVFCPKDLNEQAAIANILSGLDHYLYSLRALILKKEGVKKALSFELLSQRKRLKGFTQAWQKVRLGDVATFLKGKGLSKSQVSPNAKHECILYGELFTHYDRVVTNIKSFTNIYDNPMLSLNNDVLMPGSDVTPNGLATASCILKKGVILGGDILIIRPNSNLLSGCFLAYCIVYDKNQVLSKVVGSTVYHLYAKDMKDFEILLPPLNEQIAIANVLSDLDHEIISLKNKKRQFENIKKALNHDLMSAKIRVLKK
ncbi:restriction endonuclease subunit S [Helicobacter pylori]|uniref:restriction endonuclease subunit S n=1 Tax=Helicobacter pylori TaxID=210 RepID=UPI000D3AB488|nr:restriction endonuclease subunit S [Helicobacter pylori]PUD45666.1 type I restriction endonuclease subunit S [Helicobacter pylori]